MNKILVIAAFFSVSFSHAQIQKEISGKFINALFSQRFPEAESLTDSVFQSKADTNMLKALQQNITRQFGNFIKIDSSVRLNDYAYEVTADFENAAQGFYVSFNKENKITGLGNGKTKFKNRDQPSLFKETEYSVKAFDGVLYGSLMTPKNFDRNTPVVLIIAGSGPTDRNGNDSALGLNCNSYKMLADSLAAHNIASFRYDKIFSGESKKSASDIKNFRFNNYVYDADSIYRFLKKQFARIYIAGHSEGSLVGILLSQKNNPNGFISLSGVGENIAATLKRQFAAQLPDTIETNSILNKLQNGQTVDSIKNTALKKIFNPASQPYLISWMQYDPQKEIAKVTSPVLILQGKNDIQVTVQDAQNLKSGNPSAKLILIDSMNHIFKNAPLDRMQNISTYNNPLLPINNHLAGAIVDFINKNEAKE